MEVIGIEAIAGEAVERLLDRAFGADRHGRTAYRLRAGTRALPRLSLAAVEGGRLLGSIQCWPVRFVGDDGTRVPLVLVGPVAVEPALQQGGIGRKLMAASLAVAESRGLSMMLIGDPEYYGRFFGFTADATTRWRLPGPVDPHRLLARGPDVPDGAGVIEAEMEVKACQSYDR